MKINKNKKGFTLTELIIVIVIIGILAAVLIPSLSSYIKKAKVSKGEQNARNMTSLIVGEVLLNDKEFLMPDEIVEIVKKSGYDLISELEEYAYWYDTEHNRIEYVKIADAVKGVSASSEDSRSRIECLSPAHPKWFYIDQTPNAIRKTIDGVNNLYKNAKEQAGIIGTPTVEGDYQNILNRMDVIFNALLEDLESMKLLKKDGAMREAIVNYAKTFDTESTIYYTEDGIFNKKLFGEKNNTLGFKADSVATITDSSVEIDDARVQKFSHGVVATGTKELKLNTEFSKIAIAFDSPILIPTTVVNVNDAFITLVSGTILVSTNNLLNTAKLGHPKGKVEISNLATINIISYSNLPYELNYKKHAYRFVTGVIFVLDEGKKLYVDGRSGYEGILWEYDGTTFSKYIPDEYKNGTAENVYYTYNVSNASNSTKYQLVTKEISNAASPTEYDTAALEKALIAEYLIPTIDVKVSEINFSEFISGGKINGDVNMQTKMDPYSVKFSGSIVNSTKGYKFDNVGYITDVLYGVDQLVVEKNEQGEIISSTMYGNNEAKITINVPDTANKFVNFDGVKVTVDYKYVYYEYVDSKWLEKEDLRVQTGVKYYSSDERKEQKLDGNIYDGFTLDVSGISSHTCKDGANSVRNCNQIEITKIQITDNEGNVLFVRYFR